MNEHAIRAAEVESAFLAGAEANLNQAKGRRLPGTQWTWTTRCQDEKVRARLIEQGLGDRELLRRLPKNTTRTLTGTVPRFFFGKRKASVAISSTLAPLEHLATSDEPPPPIGLSVLMAHLRELTAGATVPHLVGVCSPSGFTDDARRAGIELPKVTLVLIEPRKDGGWVLSPGSPDATPADCRLFDPEATAQKIARVREEIESRAADLVTGGLSAAGIAERLGLTTRLVATAFEQTAGTDSELRVSRQRDDVLLFRGAPARFRESENSMVNWVRQLFSGEGDEARKINVLSERRAQLVQRRDRIYADLGKLEGRETDLLRQGKESASPAVKRRVASQIKQLRDDMNRLHATARMLGQQVDVISTHIHNLTLIQQGHMARLPEPEEMTEDAVRAEEMLEQLSADVELAGSLGMGVNGQAATDEELDILRELEDPDLGQSDSPSPTPARTPPQRLSAREPTKPQRGEPEAG